MRLRVALLAEFIDKHKIFQFLLVRLREALINEAKEAFADISIPSGAIKSSPPALVSKNTPTISIPSGAIKSCVDEISLSLTTNFNSFWCD